MSRLALYCPQSEPRSSSRSQKRHSLAGLRLYCPDEKETTPQHGSLRLYQPEEDAPATLQLHTFEPTFPRAYVPQNDHHNQTQAISTQSSAQSSTATPVTNRSVVDRAKTVHANRQCNCCSSLRVIPLELNNQILNRTARPIRGTGTLVGFQCLSCDHEWSPS